MTETVREPASGPERQPLRRPRDNRRRAAESGGAGPTTGPVTAPVPRSVPAARTTGTPPTGLTGPMRLLLGPVTGSLRLGRGRSEGVTDQRLRVDWPQCKAHGLCAEIAPEVIQLDEWGYPLFDPGALSPQDAVTARKAAQVCPTLALRLVEAPPAPDRTGRP